MMMQQTPTVVQQGPLIPPAPIELLKLEVNTKFIIVNDQWQTDGDIWLLDDGGAPQYHWLRDDIRDLGNILNNNNGERPGIIPVIVLNSAPLQFAATFNPTAIGMGGSVVIRVTDNQNFHNAHGAYQFLPQQHPVSGNEFTLMFTSYGTLPYENTVRYIQGFQLNFEWSQNGSPWFPLYTVQLDLYIPWKDPSVVYNNLPSEIKWHSQNRWYIFETLIWLGCAFAHTLGNNHLNDDVNEQEIIDAVFHPFVGLNIKRRREGEDRPNGNPFLLTDFSNLTAIMNSTPEGLGYWRGASNLARFTPQQRGLRNFLSMGEARCGEWTNFFQNILVMQGLDVLEKHSMAICTNQVQAGYNFCVVSHRNYQDNNHQRHFSINFAVRNATHDVRNPHMDAYINFSVGQGGNGGGLGLLTEQHLFMDHIWVYYKGRFFDPSYGKSYDTNHSNLEHYCNENIGSIFIYINNNANSPGILTNETHDFIFASGPAFINNMIV